jgi:hypothetical protein
VSASAAADASGRTVMAGTLGSSQIGKIVGAVGALVVALCGLSFLVIKPKARKA